MNELRFFVDERKCIRCGACVRDCPAQILKFDATQHPAMVEDGAKSCIRCQHCLAVCPSGAVSILGRDPMDSQRAGAEPAPEAMLAQIKMRRTCRNYRKEAVDADTLHKLLGMLDWVPTGVNNHSLDFAVVDDPAVMDEIRAEVNDRVLAMMKMDPLPPFAARMERYRKQILAGRDVIFLGAPHLIAVSSKADSPCPEIDPVIALSYFELYAQTLGVGTTWCGLAAGAFKVFPKLRQRIGVPDGYELGYVMLFGPTSLKYPRATQPGKVRLHSVK